MVSDHFMKLNDYKTDVIVFGTKQMLKDFRISIGDSTMILSLIVRNLGVVFDPSVNMTNHIRAICRTAYMYLQNISHIMRYLTTGATTGTTGTVLAGLPRDQIHKPQ